MVDCIKGNIVGKGETAANGIQQRIKVMLLAATGFEDAEEVIVQVFLENGIVSQIKVPDSCDAVQHAGNGCTQVFALGYSRKPGIQGNVQSQGILFCRADGNVFVLFQSPAQSIGCGLHFRGQRLGFVRWQNTSCTDAFQHHGCMQDEVFQCIVRAGQTRFLQTVVQSSG